MLTATNTEKPVYDLSIVVPVYRSQDCLTALITTIDETLTEAGISYQVILVNDYSPDNSWCVIESLCLQYPNVVGVDLRRNFGQDNAILTGLRLARGNYVAVMDDDLQHHPKYLAAMIQKAEEGFDVVYAAFRTKRQKLWKNVGSWINGKIADAVLYKPKHVYLSPYKVIRGDVARLIQQHAGPSPYIDGLLFQVTWRVASIPVEHMPRYSGSSNYPFWRAVGVSARLLFSFSIKPVRLVTWFGFGTAVIGLAAAVGVLLYRLLLPEDFPPTAVGWASLMVTFLVMAGLQMMFFGILGEYAGRTYLRVNDKPQTSVREVLNQDRGGSPVNRRPVLVQQEVLLGRQSGL